MAASAQGYIPISSPFEVPQGLTKTSTPQGGTAYVDSNGTYGVAGSIYIPGTSGYSLVTKLPGPLGTTPSTNGTPAAINPANPGEVTVGVPGTTPATATNPVATVTPTGTGTPVGNSSTAPISPTATPAPTTSTPPSTTTPVAPPPVAPVTTPAPIPPVATPSTTGAGADASGITEQQYQMTPQEASSGAAGIAAYNARIAALIQAQGDAMGSAPVANSDSGVRTSASIEADFQSTLDSLGAPPTPPDTTTDQTNAENAAGIPAIQSQIDSLNAQMTSITNSSAVTDANLKANSPGVVLSVVNGELKYLDANTATQVNAIKAQLTTLNAQLKNANTAVATIMKNTQTDYTNASNAYNKAYADAYQLYTSEESQFSKDQASALANEKVIVSSFKGSQAGVSSITQDDINNWDNLDLQAGLPAGTTYAAIQAELNITKFVKGSDGNMYVEGVDPNGVPYVAQVQGSQGAGSGGAIKSGTWTNTQLQNYTNQFGNQLNNNKGADGMVSDGTWDAALANWLSLGGTSATFETQFKQYKSTNASASSS